MPSLWSEISSIVLVSKTNSTIQTETWCVPFFWGSGFSFPGAGWGVCIPHAGLVERFPGKPGACYFWSSNSASPGGSGLGTGCLILLERLGITHSLYVSLMPLSYHPTILHMSVKLLSPTNCRITVYTLSLSEVQHGQLWHRKNSTQVHWLYKYS